MKTGHIYLISCEGSSRVKIGYSKDPAKRISKLATASPGKLTIAYLWSGTQQDEYFIHQRMSECRVHLEWFEIPVSEAISRITSILESSCTDAFGVDPDSSVAILLEMRRLATDLKTCQNVNELKEKARAIGLRADILLDRIEKQRIAKQQAA